MDIVNGFKLTAKSQRNAIRTSSLSSSLLSTFRTITPVPRTRVYKGKVVKCTLVQALRLCTGRMAHRGSRGIALPLHDHGTRRGWGVSVTPRPLFSPGKDPVPIVHEPGWAPEPVWTGAENLAPTVIRSPYRPARSQSLYRLSYPDHRVYKQKGF
jgi:hypothetical protein